MTSAGGYVTFTDGVTNLREDYTYSPTNQVTDIKRYTDLTGTTLRSETVETYYDNGQLHTITHKNGAGTTVDSFSYNYNAAGQVTGESSTLGPTKTYTYDPAGQLLGDGTNTYGYDLNGNRNTAGYTTGTGNLYSAAAGYTLTYDDAGNLATKSKTGEYWQYNYDTNNRLTDVTEKTSSGGSLIQEVKYSYDVKGNRVEKDVDANGDGVFESITKFAYDLNGNAWADLTSGGSLTTRRVYEDAVDALFARIGASNNPAFYLDDLLGSVRDIVSGPGSLIDNLSYDSYGTVTTETSPSNGDRYAWTSRERDTEINLQYNRARYYDPATGRWISQDPLGFDAGDGNLSRYLRNRPLESTDSSGCQTDAEVEAHLRKYRPPRPGEWVLFEKSRHHEYKETSREISDDRKVLIVTIKDSIRDVTGYAYVGRRSALTPEASKKYKEEIGALQKRLDEANEHLTTAQDLANAYARTGASMSIPIHVGTILSGGMALGAIKAREIADTWRARVSELQGEIKSIENKIKTLDLPDEDLKTEKYLWVKTWVYSEPTSKTIVKRYRLDPKAKLGPDDYNIPMPDSKWDIDKEIPTTDLLK